MSLAAGTRLGPYEITALIGAGGMGEVYRARDTRLDRTVAIKVSSAQFSERFEREARAVAALNHPHICTLHDVGPNYLVMEFLEGQPLDRLIPAGGMRLDAALKIAVQMAGALADAHAHGIVHRDLKPGNVMVTEAGIAKLLDFGLAAQDQSSVLGDNAATRTVLPGTMTAQGTIVGTFSYMSPEQAEGHKLDARTDIFSFGSVFYEMLTGQRAFQGQTTISTLAAILNQEPRPPAQLVESLPRDVERIVTRCLRKDPDRRFQHASDLRVELQELADSLSSGAATAPVAAAPMIRRSGSFWPAVAALALAAGAAAGWLLHRAPPPFRAPVITRMTYDSGLTCDPALSSDGKLLAYASDRAGKGNLDIWVQPAAGGDPVQLTRDESDESEPSFSPSGAQIAYRSEREGGGIYVISALGGEPRLVARAGRGPRFSPDGNEIAYWTGKGGRSENLARQAGQIFVVPAGGGEPRRLASKIPGASTPVWSADGRMLLFAGASQKRTAGRNYNWYLVPVAGDNPVATDAEDILAPENGQIPTPARWLPDHRVLFAWRRGDQANVYQIPLDPATAKVSGKPEQLTFGGGVEDSPSVAANGRIAVADLTWNFDIWSLPVDTRSARVTGEPVRLTEALTAETYPSLSADGRKLCFLSERGRLSEVWVRDLVSGKSARLLAAEDATRLSPRINQDGSTVAYMILKDGKGLINTVPAAGGLARRACNDCGVIVSWTRSGSMIHSAGVLPASARRILVSDPNTGTSRVLLESPRTMYQVSFSPDEKWIAFVQILPSLQTMRLAVAPATGPWPIPESQWIFLSDGSTWDDKTHWSPDGNLIYFTSERDGYRCLWAQRLDPQTRHASGAPSAIYHSHSSRRSMLNVGLSPLEVAVGPDKIVFVQGEITGNIWMAQVP